MTNISPSLPAAPVDQNGPPTFHDAAMILRSDPALSDTQRRDMISALHRVADWLELPMERLHCSIPELNDRLFRRHPAVFGVRATTFRSVCSRLRAVLRRVAGHAPLERGESMLPPVWQEFLASAADPRVRIGLRSFARWCARQGLAPGAVDDSRLASFLAEDRTTRLSAAAMSFAQTVAGAWNKARLSQAVPEAFPELRPPHKREPYTKRFEWYLPSFAEDAERYRQSIDMADAPRMGHPFAMRAGRGGLCRPGPIYTLRGVGQRPARKRLRPASVHSRMFDLRVAAAGLLACGVPREEMRSLSDLVMPLARAADVLEHYAERGMGPGSLRAMGISLLMVAEHHVGISAEDSAVLRGWIAEVSVKPQKGMTLKNRTRLAKLLVPATLMRFLKMPEHVLREAALLPEGSVEALRLRRNGMMGDLLVACPLRLLNLCNLSVDEHLLRGKGGRVTHLVIPANQTKTREDVLWPLRKDTARRLHCYLRDVRPVLAAPGSPYLFPGVEGRPISTSGARTAFQQTVERYAGAVVNPHLVRHLAVYLLLTARPGQYETASRLLGHRSTATTRNAYLGLETDSCVALYEEAVLQSQRYGAPTPVTGKPARRRRRGG